MLKKFQRMLLVAMLCMPWVMQAQCDNGVSCNITIQMSDDWGDGWYDADDDPFYIMVYQNNTLLSQVTLTEGTSGTQTVTVCAGDTVRFVFSGDDYYEESSFVILDGANNVIVSGDCFDYTTGSQIAVAANACPSCIAPTGISSDASDADNILVWWNGVAGANGYDVVVLPAGVVFNEATANINSVSDTSVTIDTLSSGSYNVYVRSNCGGGDYSVWVSTSFVIGGCSVTIVGSDSFGDGWNGGFLDIVQGGLTIGSYTLGGGYSGSGTFDVAGNMPVSFVWTGGSYVSEVSFSIYNFGNVLLYSVSSPSDGTVFTLESPCSDCFAPNGLQTDSLTSDYARVVWAGTASSYGVIWGESVDVADGNGTTSVESNNYFEMTGLSSGTGYTIMMWTICDDNETSDTVTYTFATIGDAVSEFPYVTGFETGDDMAWSFVNDGNNKWTIGAGAAHNGSNGLYISNDNGATNAYTVSGTQFSYAYRTLSISEDGQYALSFDWKAYGEGNYDYLRAWIAPASATLTAGQLPDGSTSSYNYTSTTPAGWIDLGGKMNVQNSWQTIVATPSLTAGSYYLVFMWANDVSVGTQPPAAIDNIDFRALSCPQPTNLTAVPHSHEVDLSWTAGGSEGAWEIIISDTVVDYSTSNSYTVQGLNADTYYHFAVRAICDDGDTSFVTTTGNVRTLVACPPVVALSVDSVTMTEMFVSWTIGDDESSWIVSINDSIVGDAYDTSFYFSGLDINTIYTIAVRALCGDGDTSAASVVNGRTLAGAPISDFPYNCGFEINANNEDESLDWVLENGSQTNYWMVGAGTNNGGSKAMYITNDGTNNSYNTSSTSYSFAYAVFQFDAGEYAYSYDWKADGESSYDYLRAAVVPNVVEITAGGYCGFNNTSGMPTGGIAIDGAYRMNLQSNWQTQSGTFTIATSGAYKVVFFWYNDFSSGTQPPAAIDNISIVRNTCPSPMSLTATVNGSDVDFSWTDTLNSSWDVVYGNTGFDPNSSSNINTVSSTSTQELALADGFYDVYVRANCGNGDYSLWVGPVDFSIGITVTNMTASNDSISTCMAIIYDDGGANGDYSSGQNSQLVVYPSDPTKRFKLWGNGSTESCCDYLFIYAGNQASGTPIATIQGSGIVLDTILTQGGPITLQFYSDGSLVYGGFAIYLECVDMPACSDVANLSVLGNTFNSVTLDWGSYTGTDNSWVVSYSTTQLADPMNGNTVGVSAHPYTVTGLTSGTDYYFYVMNDCGSDSSTWSMIGPIRPGSWEMRANQTDTLYMCGGTIYDDGGLTGSYSTSQDSYIILRPDTSNMLVSVSGTSYTEGSWDYLTIYDGIGTSGTELWSDYGSSSSQSFGPIESLSGPLTIAFHSDGSITYDGFVINVSCVSTSCRVMNLGIDASVGESSSQLAITWDAVAEAQQYQIEYGAIGFELGQGQTMTTTNNSAVITGLAALTNYDVYVRSICTGGEEGLWAHATLQTSMCDNPVELYNYDASQTSSTSSHFPIGYSYWNYSYVQTIIPASRLTDLTGEITAFAFNPTSVTAGSSEFEGMTMWMANVSEDNLANGFILPDETNHVFQKVIDNASFSYNETGWRIHSLDSAFSWDGVSNVLVAVNRVNGTYGSSPSFASHEDTVARACYVYNDDYPYDYTSVSGGTSSTTVGDILLISCGVGCARPSGLYATDVNYASATLHWSGSASDYEVSVKASTAGTWPEAVAVSNASSYDVSGLTPDCQYQFRVRAICDAAAGQISDWSVGNFTTDELPCMVPEDLHIVEVHTTAVTLGWTAIASQDQWSIHVWNTAGEFDYTANGNPYTVTGLAANTTYNAAIKAVCGGGAAESEYGDTITFTTSACPQVTGVRVDNITSHSAVVSWNEVAGSSYVIEYGDRNFTQGSGTTVTIDEGVTSYTITGLDADEDYTVFVMAECDGVHGDWSQQVDFSTNSSDGIDVTMGAEGVTIYPNPTSDNATISLSGVNGEVTISVVDMNGRIVKTTTAKNSEFRLDVRDLAQGAYFVRVSGEGINVVKKLVVK